MLVVDASAVVDLLLELPASEAVAAHLDEHDQIVAAPHFVDLEVLSALRRVVRSRQVDAERAEDAVLDLLDFTIDRYAHEPLLPRIWHLRDNLSAYDAAYLALAEVLADETVPLLTTDAHFARAARKHSDVEVLLAA